MWSVYGIALVSFIRFLRASESGVIRDALREALFYFCGIDIKTMDQTRQKKKKKKKRQPLAPRPKAARCRKQRKAGAKRGATRKIRTRKEPEKGGQKRKQRKRVLTSPEGA